MAGFNRREFMRRGAAGAAGMGLFLNGEYVAVDAATPLPEPAAPSDRVNVGFIGFGIRGNILFESCRLTGQANLVEVCDCYKGHLERARERTEGKIDTNFAQYKKLLDRKDIDAVVIATPDHWHKPLFLDAIAAGKDVYIEKPMTHRIADGQEMINAARKARRIVQVGSQWISSSQNKIAKEMVSSGKVGKVTKVMAAYNRNSSAGAWNYPIPPDLENGVNFNWEEWLGSAPQRPYDPERVFRYRKYWDYSGGITTDLFVHLITSIHYVLGATMPRSVVSTGGILARNDGRQVPDTLDALFEYPEGFHVNMASTFNAEGVSGNGIHFLGTDGSLVLPLGGSSMVYGVDSHREGYSYSIDSWPVALQERFMNVGNRREEAARKAPPPKEIQAKDSADPTTLHLAAFFDCVRTRKQCDENAEVGHRAASAGHMVNLSYTAGKKVVWDEASGTAIA
ncbi:MAG: Gfo/Idh/MocA family oxidoreductase [Acidobacteria bacterium]|nr:MAG: Gfo/Idh/MocA family oxidoreductase [Acidobacteriota bacterium]